MIELKNVYKRYGDAIVINNMSFKIEKGEIVGFLGQNGAGKTTTMKLITGLISPSDGEVLIEGEKLSSKNKSKIGYMPENVPLYESLSVREFIDFMAEMRGVKKGERKEVVSNIITKLNLKDVEKSIIKNISRGYKQRVSLAGTLVGNPQIVLLDEPTVGLDPKQVIEIRNLIKSLAGDHTILVSSHILSEISQMCQKVIIIDKGKLITIDSPKNLEDKLSTNKIQIIVEDPKEKIDILKNKIPEIIKIEFVKKESKKEKLYEFTIKENEDIRKKIIDIAKGEGINIIELRRVESSLEDVFVSLIDKKEGN